MAKGDPLIDVDGNPLTDALGNPRVADDLLDTYVINEQITQGYNAALLACQTYAAFSGGVTINFPITVTRTGSPCLDCDCSWEGEMMGSDSNPVGPIGINYSAGVWSLLGVTAAGAFRFAWLKVGGDSPVGTYTPDPAPIYGGCALPNPIHPLLEQVRALNRSAVGLTKAALHIGRATDEAIASRREICAACPNAEDFAGGIVTRCKLCRCILEAKTLNAGQKCPDHPPRW